MTRWISRFPDRAAAAFLIGFAGVWWCASALSQATLPLDMMEATAWGPGWQLVYHKHPPLPAWVTEAVIVLFGRTDWVLMALGPICVAITGWLVWYLARRLLDPIPALMAVGCCCSLYYTTLAAAEFNHNVALYPAWTGLIVFGHGALKHGRVGSWLAVAVCAAIGVYTKYAIALPVLTLVLIALCDPRARSVWRKPGPYVAGGVGVFLIAPHLWALWRGDFGPLRYAADRAHQATSWIDHLVFPLSFAGAQLLACSAVLMLVGLVRLSRPRAPVAAVQTPEPFDRRYIWLMTAGPLVLTMAGAAAIGQEARSMWGSPMWATLGLAALITVDRRRFTASGVRRWLIGFGVVSALFLVAFLISNLFGAHITNRTDRVNWPAEAVAAAVERTWHSHAGEQPIDVLAGPMWTAGAVAFYGEGRPPVLLNGDRRLSPWIDPALIDNGHVLAVWWIRWDWQRDGTLPEWLESTGRTFAPLAPVEVPWGGQTGLPPVRIGMAVSDPG